jgi:predicted nucleotidyltransferase component of viral defense system
MSVQLIQDRLGSYQCRSIVEEELALRQITQEIVLAALGRTDYFQKAAFQGGTCLRIFHGLNRFSEDLDFALSCADRAFELQPYLRALGEELRAWGYRLEIDDRSKAGRAVRIAFLKDDSLGSLLHLSFRPDSGPLRKIRVKLEVDTNPPAGATYNIKYLDFPFVSAVRIFDLPSLFAGKLHALLCREYAKGRDWYDLIWYTARRTPVNYVLLNSALNQAGPWRGKNVKAGRAWCVRELSLKIKAMDWEKVRADVHRFVPDSELPSLKLWGTELFLGQCDKIA